MTVKLNEAYLKNRTNKDFEIEGINIKLDSFPGVTVKIARAGGANKQFLKYVSKEFKGSITAEDAFDEEKTDILIRAYSIYIIKDWNITNKYDSKIGFDILKDDQDLFTEITTLANLRETFLQIDKEESSKNLKSSSNGS